MELDQSVRDFQGTPESVNLRLKLRRRHEAPRYRLCIPIDADGDPAEIGGWISEAKAQRVQAEADLRKATSTARITRHQVEELISMTADIAATLLDAEPAQMADAYRKLGVRLTYDPAGPLIRATADPQSNTLVKRFVSEGGSTHTPTLLYVLQRRSRSTADGQAVCALTCGNAACRLGQQLVRELFSGQSLWGARSLPGL